MATHSLNVEMLLMLLVLLGCPSDYPTLYGYNRKVFKRFKRFKSKTTEPISINFFLKKLDFFPYNSMKSFCRNSICEIFYGDSKFVPKIHSAMKKCHRWNFDKNSSLNCREKNLVSF